MFMLEHETQSLNLESGRLCLDFANTADWHTSDQPEEQLNSYTDLVEWAKGVGILTEGQARQLASAAMNRSAEVADVLARAIDLREAIFRPVAQSAADLLTSEELNRVGQCADDHCGWLFMDMSRNRSRRWCDMGDCGNRAKARRHYQRKRSIGSTDVGKK
jgi:predicted RNA-binding Zn ribbon-like protein